MCAAVRGDTARWLGVRMQWGSPRSLETIRYTLQSLMVLPFGTGAAISSQTLRAGEFPVRVGKENSCLRVCPCRVNACRCEGGQEPRGADLIDCCLGCGLWDFGRGRTCVLPWLLTSSFVFAREWRWPVRQLRCGRAVHSLRLVQGTTARCSALRVGLRAKCQPATANSSLFAVGRSLVRSLCTVQGMPPG